MLSLNVLRRKNIVICVQGGPKISDHQESSLSRIKTVINAKFYINFDYEINTRV